MKLEVSDEWCVDIFRFLQPQEERGRRSFHMLVQGGNSWCGGWKSIKSSFGNSMVKVHGQRKRLHDCKRWIEQGADVEFCHLRLWKPKAGPDKRFLISILRNPGLLAKLSDCNLEVLVRLMDAAKDFLRPSTTAYLRRHITHAIKQSFGWCINSRILVRLKYDDRIKVVEVRKLLNDKIECLDIPTCIKNTARSAVRIVWVKNPSVADLLHNQRAFAHADVSTCTCAGSIYPKVGGHVQVRLQDIEGVHPLILNANNVLKQAHPDRCYQLMKEMELGLDSWANRRGATPAIHLAEVQRCMVAPPACGDKYLDVKDVRRLSAQLSGLVLTPLDRNPGETLVLCPKLYYEAMMNLFVCSSGYVIEQQEETAIHATMVEDLRAQGLLRFARWDKWVALEKSEFFLSEISFLGYIVTVDGLKPDPRKVAAVQDAPAPVTLIQVRAFLGLASYYRRFIKGFVGIAKPLTNLLKKEEQLIWTPECEAAFQTLKEALTCALVLARPDPTRPFALYTDWQPQAISAVLTQHGKDGREHVIEYASKTLSQAQANYEACKGECLAVVWGIQHIRLYLYRQKFVLVTDHQPLLSLRNNTDYTGTLGRWVVRMQDYDFDIRHRATRQHGNADGLMRLLPPNKCPAKERLIPWRPEVAATKPHYGELHVLRKDDA
ncbi:hypothetical protein CBR_g3634 [Chara braunii]|uniref:Reverse transcriptase/retrotransposon-derived protein RNase H-like domain-containing protein n=1 Tax=Chara braunii TaxID=69332 RepID=A0A388KFV9_CHABU|nr:hypothetical protein CBR_g3634 [Chara braunii]|eukprot:GBG68935.1 hypothetical protein CBR_g3634 [Chara braunii]